MRDVLPAPPDRARRWDDLEASWSFCSRIQRQYSAIRNGFLITDGDFGIRKSMLVQEDPAPQSLIAGCWISDA